MSNDPKVQLLNFEIDDCAVRSDSHFYFLASHTYNLSDEDDEDAHDPVVSAEARTLMPLADQTMKAAIRIAVFFSDRAPEKQWAFRTIRGIEVMRCAGALMPLPQLVSVSDDGQVFVLGSGVGEMQSRISGHQAGPLRGIVRQVISIAGVAYAIQTNRGICKRLAADHWQSLCANLPVSRSNQRHKVKGGFSCAAGSHESDIYAGGGDGDLWHFDGSVWTELDFPNAFIEAICCVSAAEVYVACEGGTIYQGSGNSWRKYTQITGARQFRSLLSFGRKLWCAAEFGIWAISVDEVIRVAMPLSFIARHCRLATNGTVLLATSYRSAAFFDGVNWTSIL